MKININDLVMIKEGEKNRGKWKIGIIRNICMGMDNTIRLTRIRTRKSIIERPDGVSNSDGVSNGVTL